MYDDDFDEQPSGPKALRDARDAAVKKAEELQAELEKRDKTIAELSGKVKSSSLRDALQDAGVDPKYARFADRDGIEPTAEAVKTWVEENRDVYAFLNASQQSAPTEGEPGEQAKQEGEETGGEMDPDYVEQLRAGQAAASVGRTPGPTNIEQALEGANPASFQTEAEIDAYIQATLEGRTPGA